MTTTSIADKQPATSGYNEQAALQPHEQECVIISPLLQGHVKVECDPVDDGAILVSLFCPVPLVVRVKHFNPINKSAYGPQFSHPAFSDDGHYAQVFIWADEYVTVGVA